ncbi:predicted protein [Naegleria gruberi]|uniref:Predicted protein n=1 Tax=Naegleria gruberi TaxID=5762 RepID=D2VPP5_NAEGR|nr:uncharacterized protein NAEGRDRAFT_70936 [Naegleria gruberi]EFC41163.1 predicted protein [Naegleria gruberi]|eukprot:XP_002673907.1 predicted protein [Naegleria gruberi strain NEG-M]
MKFLPLVTALLLVLGLASTIQSSIIQKRTSFGMEGGCSSRIAFEEYQNTTNCTPQPCHMLNLAAEQFDCVDHFPSLFPRNSVLFIEHANNSCDDPKIVSLINIKFGVCFKHGSSILSKYGLSGAYINFKDCKTIETVMDAYNFGCSHGFNETITKSCSNGVSFKCF